MNSEAIQVDIFCGSISPEAAQVYVRAEGASLGAGAAICGYLRGPQIAERRTLPTTVPLAAAAPGESHLTCAKIVDPCFWSPEHPALYEAVVEIKQLGAVLATIRRQFGVRSLTTRGGNLILEGKRWVLRGALLDQPDENDLNTLREQSMALLAARPSDDLCEWASREGVFIAARVAGSQTEMENELRRLAQWAAVGFAVIEDGSDIDVVRKSAAPNLLLGQRFAPGRQAELAPWAQVAICRAADLADFPTRGAKIQFPVIALRRADESLTLQEARSGCDRLQRDLAPQGDFAGYLVDLGDGPGIL